MLGHELHQCSYYCRGDEHCELIYTSLAPRDWDGADERYVTGIVREAWQAHYIGHLIRMEPAREAPETPPYEPVRIAGAGEVDHRYLIWWRE